MSTQDIRSAKRPEFDKVLTDIANYVCDYEVTSDEARQTARHCLMDSIGCMMLALKFPECTKLLGPVVPGAGLKGGAKVPGTPYELDPVQGAFNIGALVRWLDFNDTWLAAEWGHPSDNIGAILAVADYVSRRNLSGQTAPLTIGDVLDAMVKAHEIQGVLALENSFNRAGLDHVLLVRVASTAVVTRLLGGSRQDVLNAVSNAWIDGGALRTYRHAPNTGSRKSWAAGDATRRAVQLSLIALTGEMGYPSALTTKTWGFYDVLCKGEEFRFQREYGSYVMENVLFKIAFPAEFHAQTAVEAALKLHEEVKDRLDDIERIEIETQEAGVRIIDKTGPLDNPADRDHCLQYMVAVPLIFGELTAEHYEDDVAADTRIDRLRNLMEVSENKSFTEGYFDPERRAIGNAVRIVFRDGSKTERVEVEYPIGHRRRRKEGIPVLERKFADALATRLPRRRRERVIELCGDQGRLEATPVNAFMDLLAQ